MDPELTKALEALGEKLKEQETKANDALTALRKEIDPLKSDKDSKRIESLSSDLVKQQEMLAKLKADMAQMQTKAPTGNSPEMVKSLGEIFTSDESVARFLKDKPSTGGVRFEVPGGSFKNYKQFAGRKDSGSLSTADLAALSAISLGRVQQIFAQPTLTMRVRDRLMPMTTKEESVTWIQETKFHHISAKITTQAVSGQKAIIVDNANGFVPGSTLNIDFGGTDAENIVIDTVNVDTKTITSKTNLAKTHNVTIEVGSNVFSFIPGVLLKPNAKPILTSKTEPIRTLPHGMPLPKASLLDHTQLQSYINGRLLYGLDTSVERAILNNVGSADQFSGICNVSGVQTYAWSSGTYGDKRQDAIRRAITLAALLGYPVDTVVLHPTDFESIELDKTSIGGYTLFTSIAQGLGTAPVLWRTEVVESPFIDPGKFVVGAFAMAAAWWDREQASIEIATQHEDQFMRNMIQLLAELRGLLTVFLPEAFVYGDFDEAPPAPAS